VTNLEDHWDAVYSANPVDEVTWYQEIPAVSLDLIAAVGIGAHDRVIDVGSGASTLVDHLLGTGHLHVVLADVSAVALAATRERLGDQPAVSFVLGDVLDLEIGSVAMWHDRAVFHFIVDPEERLRYKVVMARHVARGGHAIVATFASDGPERCSGLPVTRHSVGEIAEFFSPEFSLVESRREIHRTPRGGEQSFSFALLRREASP
jgi:hypothetical protein